jgi:hypothetical protein
MGIVLTLALLAACAEAGGGVTGGDLTDAGTIAIVAPEFISPCKETTEDVGAGSKWSDLYRDIFSVPGRPGSCSFTTACHTPPGGSGFQTFQCVDVKTCREDLLKEGQVLKQDGSGAKPANETYLLTGLLRTCKDGTTRTGFMPKEPASFVFPKKSVDRIAAWINAGAPDD